MRTDPDFTELRTERLRLRRSVPADADTISAYRSMPEVHVHQGWDRTDPDGVRTEIEEMASRAPGEPGGWVQFTLERLADRTIVGDVGLSPDEQEPAVMKLGYTVAPVHQRLGYATEAVRALVGYAFDRLDAGMVRAFADAGNVASTRVMEKAGLRLVETFEYPDDDQVWLIVRYERERS